jgi:hypothetical protein
MASSGFEPATFRLLAEGLNQLHYRVPRHQGKNLKSNLEYCFLPLPTVNFSALYFVSDKELWGSRGLSVSNYTCNVTPLHSSIQTVSRETTSKTAHRRISQDML